MCLSSYNSLVAEREQGPGSPGFRHGEPRRLYVLEVMSDAPKMNQLLSLSHHGSTIFHFFSSFLFLALIRRPLKIGIN